MWGDPGLGFAEVSWLFSHSIPIAGAWTSRRRWRGNTLNSRHLSSTPDPVCDVTGQSLPAVAACGAIRLILPICDVTSPLMASCDVTGPASWTGSRTGRDGTCASGGPAGPSHLPCMEAGRQEALEWVCSHRNAQVCSTEALRL